MKPEELAAYIGAAAWLPQIISWLYRAIVKAKLRIVPDQMGEFGFTAFGPIFNLRMAFFVEAQDLIIDGFDLEVSHEDGEGRTFRWAGLAETFSEITDSSGNKQIVSRDQTPIAVKVSTRSMLEKFVRFQEPKYHQMDRAMTSALVEQFNFLKQKNPDSYVQDVLGSKEYFSVVGGRRNWFWWKPGRYEVVLKLSSPQAFTLLDGKFAFELSKVDIEQLKKNLEPLDAEIRNIINSNLPDAKPQPFTWQWVNVTMLRSRGA